MSSIGGYLQRKSSRKLAKVKPIIKTDTDSTALAEAWDTLAQRTTSTWSASTSTSRQTELTKVTEQNHQQQAPLLHQIRPSHLAVPKLPLHNLHPPRHHTPKVRDDSTVALAPPVSQPAQRSIVSRPPPTRRETTSKSMASLRRAIAHPFRHTESSSGNTPPTEYFFQEEPFQPSRLGQVNSHTSHVTIPFSLQHGFSEQGEVVARARQDEVSTDRRQGREFSREDFFQSRNIVEDRSRSQRRSSGGVFFATKSRDAPNSSDEPVKTARISRARSIVKKPEYLDMPVPTVSLSFLEEMQMNGLCLQASNEKP